MQLFSGKRMAKVVSDKFELHYSFISLHVVNCNNGKIGYNS